MYEFIEEKSCDFAVMGGGSGLVAAARAARAGYQVIVLERANVCGGGMLFASTMRTFGSKWQERNNCFDNATEFCRKMMDECFWRVDPHLAANIYRGTGEFFDWICELCGFPDDMFRPGRYVFDGEDGPVGPQYGGQHNGFGRVVVETLVKMAPELGMEICTKHRVVDCEVENGRITALIAETPAGYVRVRCRACLLAPGSWISNREITNMVMPTFYDVEMPPSAHVNPNYTGDALPLAEKVGAFVDYDSFCLRLMGPFYMAKNRTYSGMTTNPYCISVNLLGKRYVSEPLVSHMEQFDAGSVIGQQPNGKVFCVFSENMLREAIALREDGPFIPDANLRGEPLPATMEEVHADIAQAKADGLTNCFAGDTLEDLCAAAGIDYEGMRQTVEEYNLACEQQMDWGFFKPAKYLVPLSEGPFYAVSGYMATDGAFGGIKVDPDMRAYANDGGVIEGLYVCGDFASGRHVSINRTVKRQFINDMNWSLAGSYLAGGQVIEYLA